MTPSNKIVAPLEKEGINLGISIKYHAKLIRLSQEMERHNKFWSQFIAPSILVPELHQHIALHKKTDDSFSHVHSEAAHYAYFADTLDQGSYPLFSNTMRIPRFGPGYKRYKSQWSKSWEKPSARAAIGQFWTFTFEWDSDAAEALQEQFDWVWKAGPDGWTEIQRIDRAFKAAYKDYRGYCAIWSGAKSVHLNFIFETSHLSKDTIIAQANRNGKKPEAKLRDYWLADINPDMIWDYYSVLWHRLSDAIRSNSNIDVNFDPAMSTLFQKRRTPWGKRIAPADDPRGFDEGDEIPQVVLAEKILQAAPKAASGMLLIAAEANAMAKVQKKNSRPTSRNVIEDEPELIQKLTDYLAVAWNSEYPKPAELFEDDNGIGVRFFNSANDETPSSIAYESYSSLIYRGKDAPTNEEHKNFPGKQTLHDLICDLLDEIEHQSGGTSAPYAAPCSMGATPWTKAFAHSALDQSIDGIRSGIAVGARMHSEVSSLSVLIAVEGAGKSTAFIRQAGDVRLEDQIEKFFGGEGLNIPSNGHQIVACKMYAQAEEHYHAYRIWREGVIAGGPLRIPPPAPLLILSLAETYQRYCASNMIDPISYLDALNMGFESQVEAVLHTQPQAFTDVTEIKNKSWMYGHETNGFKDVTNVIIFTVHDMAHDYSRISKSKAWLNPSFTPAALDKYDDWHSLATEFRVYRIIHDELSVNDLVHIAHHDEVQLANTFKKKAASENDLAWSDIKASQRFSSFKNHACGDMHELGFHRINELADLNFGPSDVTHVDFHALPFGVANSDDALYKRADGEPVYIREKNWWSGQRARVVFTTTESLPANLAEAIFAQPSTRRGQIIRWDDAKYYRPDPVQLKIDDRANKTHVDELATEILDNPDDLTDLVISDMVTGPNIITHSRALGSNNLRSRNITTILTSIGERQYMELNAISQKYALGNVIKMFYLDRYNQAVGRNHGLRADEVNPKQHKVYMTARLLRELGGAATFQQSRYPAYLVK